MNTSYIENLYSKLSTGDILLFHGKAIVSCCIEFFSHSKYSHVGIILKDPYYIDEKLEGLYLWQSGKEDFPEVENKKYIYGVQISLLEDVIKDYGIENCYVRFLNNKIPINFKDIQEIHNTIHHIPYDLNPIDWLEAGIYELENNLENNNDKKKLINKENVKTPKSLWCSALIGYIFYKLNLINNPNWKLLSPEDWSYRKNKILQLNHCSLSTDICLLDIWKNTL